MKGSKIINIILVLLILLNIIVMTLLLIDKEKNKNKYDLEIKNFDEFIDIYGNETIGSYYKKYIQKLIEENLSSVYSEAKGLDETQLKEHYEENSSLIFSTIGIENYDDFKNLISKLDMYEDLNIRYKKVEIVKKSCKKNGDYVEAIVKIKYQGNKKLSLKISMMDSQLIIRTPGNMNLYKVSPN